MLGIGIVPITITIQQIVGSLQKSYTLLFEAQFPSLQISQINDCFKPLDKILGLISPKFVYSTQDLTKSQLGYRKGINIVDTLNLKNQENQVLKFLYKKLNVESLNLNVY